MSVAQLVSTAWASAASFRSSDKRGGANGARIRLAPQNAWEINRPDELATALRALEGVQERFEGTVSMADLIVLGGCAGVEQSARDAGFEITVPFTPGRTDATQEQTDVESFDSMDHSVDGFRNYMGEGQRLQAEYLLVDKANLLNLSAPEMTVLVGGLRVLEATHGQEGVLTDRPGTLTNDFFVKLLDMATTWSSTSTSPVQETFEGRNAAGEVLWTGTRADLVFGSNSELRAVAEVYASSDGQEKFVNDFVQAWDKVMMLDRYDIG